MAKYYSATIGYNIETKFNSNGIDRFSASLDKLQKKITSTMGTTTSKSMQKDLQESYDVIEKIKKALSESTNLSTGLLDTTAFSAKIKEAEVSTERMVKAFNAGGHLGQQSFNAMAGALGQINARMTTTNVLAQKLATTMSNTVRWGLSASLFEGFKNGVAQSIEYVKDLDTSLNNIRIVSGYNSDQMNQFAKSANVAARALGQTTTAYTNASLIYIQQGKTLEESNKLAELTLKTANVTGQDTAEVSEQLTSLMNGYQIAVDDMESSVDKLAKVAAVGASDLEELATAESKVASTANALGVSQDQLVAQLSTIISVTRQAPESVGNAIN